MQHIANTAVHIQQWMFREPERYKHDGYSAEACLTESFWSITMDGE